MLREIWVMMKKLLHYQYPIDEWPESIEGDPPRQQQIKEEG